MEEDSEEYVELDAVMRISFESLTSNIEETLNEFIVFNKNGNLIEINQGIEEKCQFIDKMIKYFESLEEFEKCHTLLELKNIIIENK